MDSLKPASLVYSDRLLLTGGWGMFVLFSSLIITISSSLILACLWFADCDFGLWRLVILNEFCIQTITITTLVLRTTTASQAGLMTSMLAALALEKFGVRLSKAAHVSILRYTNSGPHSLVMVLFSRYQRLWLFLPTAMLVVTTTLLQFSSTALIFDIGVGTIVGSQEQRTVMVSPINFSVQQTYESNHWVTKPSHFYMFGEYNEPMEPMENEAGWDTGLSRRAFLPLASAKERSTIRKISGDMPVLNSRVICLQPPTVGNVTLFHSTNKGQRDGNSSSFFISGSTTLDKSVLAGPEWNIPMNVKFNCSIATQSSQNMDPHDQAAGICAIQNSDTRHSFNPETEGQGFLFMQFNGSEKDWTKFYSKKGGKHPSFRSIGRWQELVIPSNIDISLRISVCFTNLQLKVLYSNATSGHKPIPEPVLHWNATRSRYNTSDIRKHLEGSRNPGTVLHLEHQPSLPQSFNKTVDFPWLTRVVSINQKGTAIFCAACNFTSVAGFKVNIVTTELFQDILRTTDNPAFTLQSLFTVLFQIGYYDHAMQYDLTVPTKLTLFVKRLFPVRKQAFFVVMVVVALHSILAIFVVVLFWRNVRLSRLGSAWTAVTQVYGENVTDEWFRQKAIRSDKGYAKVMDPHSFIRRPQTVRLMNESVSYRDANLVFTK